MQVEKRRIGATSDDDQMEAPLVRDVEVAEHGAVRGEDAKDVGLGAARDERLALLDEPIAVLLDGETRRSAHLLAVRRLRLERPRPDVGDAPERERGGEDGGEDGEEERDPRHAAS